MSGTLRNDEHDITLLVNTSTSRVNFTAGPLSYRYRLYQIKIHFGKENVTGSEHRIDGRGFPAEVGTIAANTMLGVPFDLAWLTYMTTKRQFLSCT